MTIRDTLVYNNRLNRAACYPIASTAIGAVRILVHGSHIIQNIVKIVKSLLGDRRNFNALIVATVVDLRGLVRGIIELPPIIGGLISWYINSCHLTPAQKLAFRIQDIYQTRLKGFERPSKDADLIDVDPKGTQYSKEFLDFINGQKGVKISTSQDKINHFVEQFKAVNLDDAIFKDPKLPYYALAAFAKGEIDRFDIATVLEMHMAKLCFKSCKVVKIFEQDGITYTKDILAAHAAVTSLPLLDHKASAEVIALPPHKRIFWHYEPLLSPQEFEKFYRKYPLLAGELLTAPIGSLTAALAHLNTLPADIQLQQEYHLSYDMEQVMLNHKYGRNNVPHVTPKLGQFTPKDIAECVTEKTSRLCATFFPGISAKHRVHDSLELPTTITVHDRIHALILHQYPQEVIDKTQKLIKAFSKVTGFAMSKEVWMLTEMVSVTVIRAQNVYKRKVKHFDEMIHDYTGPAHELTMGELFYIDKEFSVLWAINEIMSMRDGDYCLNNGITLGNGKKLTTKQNIWSLQHPGPSPEDCTLVFEKVKEGIRKNTVILKRTDI